MAIQNFENAKILKKWMAVAGRKGFGDKAIEIADRIMTYAMTGEYVEIAIEVGRMKALATASNEDTYFSEKTHMGFYKQLHECEQSVKKNIAN